MKQMDRAALEGVELEYEVRGAGEPFVLPDATHLLQVENPRGMAGGEFGRLLRPSPALGIS
jgi:hypothetical protein